MNDNKKIMSQMAPYLNMGWQLAITMGLMVLLGWWLDKKLNTSPYLIVGCSLFGIFAAMYNFFKTIMKLEKENKKNLK